MSISSKTNLIVNYLPASVSEEDFRRMFTECGEIKNMKLVRDKTTGQSLGYGFVEYQELDHCGEAIKKYNGMKIDSKVLRVSFARPTSEDARNTNLYMVGIPANIDEPALEDIFKPYGKILSTKILRKPGSGESRGIAFIKYDRHDDSETALNLMNGKVICGSSCPQGSCACTTKISIKYALPHKDRSAGGTTSGYPPNSHMPAQYAYGQSNHLPMNVPPYQQAYGYQQSAYRSSNMYGSYPMYQAMASAYPTAAAGSYYAGQAANSSYAYGQMIPSQSAATMGGYRQPAVATGGPSMPKPAAASAGSGTSLFVFGLPPACSEQSLLQLFSPFGQVLNVKIVKDVTQPSQPCKGYGFVNYRLLDEANRAITALNNYVFDGKTLQVRMKSNKDQMYSNSTGGNYNAQDSSAVS